MQLNTCSQPPHRGKGTSAGREGDVTPCGGSSQVKVARPRLYLLSFCFSATLTVRQPNAFVVVLALELLVPDWQLLFALGTDIRPKEGNRPRPNREELASAGLVVVNTEAGLAAAKSGRGDPADWRRRTGATWPAQCPARKPPKCFLFFSSSATDAYDSRGSSGRSFLLSRTESSQSSMPQSVVGTTPT